MYTVTAIITTYKRDSGVVERAIKSIEHQTYPIYETLLVDDNPKDSPYTDQIKEMLERHPQVKYYTQGDNKGVASARNYGIKYARGSHIAFLDDDDEWEPDKIEKQIAVFEKHPDAGMVFCTGTVIYEDSGREEQSWNASIFKEHPSYEDMLTHDYVCGVFSLFRRDALYTNHKPPAKIRFQQLPAVEDYEFCLQIAKYNDVYGVPEALYRYHMSSAEHVSTNHKNTYLGYKQIYINNKEAYDSNIHAKRWIMYNIMREGIKSMQPGVIPYAFSWLFCRLKDKDNG